MLMDQIVWIKIEDKIFLPRVRKRFYLVITKTFPSATGFLLLCIINKQSIYFILLFDTF